MIDRTIQETDLPEGNGIVSALMNENHIYQVKPPPPPKKPDGPDTYKIQ